MNDLASGEPAFESLSATVDPAFFRKTWRINLTVAKATICLLAQFDPQSFLAGAHVDLSDTLSAYNARQFHHINPKGHLGGQGIQFHEANVVANICMLTAADNNSISDQAPADYFSSIPANLRDEIFTRALISSEFRDGTKPFAEFVKGRATILAKKVDELIKAE